MAKTKIQKIEIVKNASEELKGASVAIIADFSGISVNDLNGFRKALKAAGLRFGVFKKRLLALVFRSAGLEFDPKRFPGQSGVVFSPKDIVETSGEVYKFAKQNDKFNILGGFDIAAKTFIEASDVKRYGALPSREALLGQLVGMLSYPIKSLLFVLNEKSKEA